MRIEMSRKKVYVMPELIVHGTVAQITASGCKQMGSTDGFYLGEPGNPITNCGS
jgi:hypothetical protein